MGRERGYLEQSLRNLHISGDGPFSKRVSALLGGVLGAKKVLLTTSYTDALELTALLLDLQPGDEVIMPSFTFVSTANAYALRGRSRCSSTCGPTHYVAATMRRCARWVLSCWGCS